MSKLYLMRHGQTQFNIERKVQGRCDSPLTKLGIEQAENAARWLTDQDVSFDRMLASPLGRTRATLDTVRSILTEAGTVKLPPIEFTPGLVERSYGTYEGGPIANVPADVWDPGSALVCDGGEDSESVRTRMVGTLTNVMLRPGTENVLAVSHGSATLQFKKAWEHLAVCPQGVPLGNCCILMYEFDRATMTFTCEQIVNHDV